MEELTHSTIYNSVEDVAIEKEILSTLSEVSETNNILSIYSMNARAIYFFPVASDVFKLSIQIFPLTPEIVAKIMNNISKISTKVVYSTGLCLVENRCFWEGFLQEKDLTVEVDEIETSLSSIAEVTGITIEKVIKTG
ncbi:MAG: hypothetical protein KAU62_15125 [Candidatus Heimdallarchaeota archaeon]|nr:hypothetical protein [Candidatus Heimdallarchaeota archaeon]MCG3257433.1 hypothetical protein [Candidatus Heimdallarchaeota archaeon]MCK4612486.1 hypothetical protein [Candidatus Heimdallarchaeota archaeon]